MLHNKRGIQEDDAYVLKAFPEVSKYLHLAIEAVRVVYPEADRADLVQLFKRYVPCKIVCTV